MSGICFGVDDVNENNYDKNAARLEANVTFANGCPCRLVERKVSECTDTGLPHYATTLEVIVTDNLKGVVRVGKNNYTVEERSVFVIPPNTIHSTTFISETGDSSVFVFKISFELLDQYLNTEKIFLSKGHSINDIPYCLSQYYSEITNTIFNKFSYDGNDIFKTVSGVIRLFRIFDEAIDGHNEKENKNLDKSILEVMQWTVENLSEPITVEMAAKKANYSKYYFCKMFKKATGSTYLKYLQLLRIEHAIELLKDGKSITNCCYECGFSSLSHFVKLFKNKTRYTPSEYKRMIKQNK